MSLLLHDPRTVNLIYFLAGIIWLYFVTLLKPDYKAMYEAWRNAAHKEREITRNLKKRVLELEGKNDQIQ